jgi:AhpD family alkylhydroperoxidase
MGKLPGPYERFRSERAAIWRAYDRLGAEVAAAGPLDDKVRELVRLGMSAAARAESAVHSHTHRALEAGATPAEVEHVILLGATTLGFPTMMAAWTWAHAALACHEEPRRPAGRASVGRRTLRRGRSAR